MDCRTANVNGKAAVGCAKEQGEPGAAGTLPLDNHGGKTDNSQPPKKRRRSRGSAESSKVYGSGSTKSNGKEKIKLYRGRNVGKLAKLLQMPVEIFCEIAAYLEPLDLLHLARSSKSFNRMLMSRDSKLIWRMARRYYRDLPDCPPDLSEPAYARLLFDKVCHVCLGPRALKVYYVSRVRLCTRCHSSNIVKGSQLLMLIPGLTEQLLDCVPRAKGIFSLAPRYWGYTQSQYFYAPQVQALVFKFFSVIPQDIPENEANVLRQEFYDTHKESVQDILQHAENIKTWESSDLHAKKIESTHASQRREASLRAKLIELGFQEADFPYEWEDGEWCNIMAQPRDLTPRIWGKVQSKLEACIQRVKQARAERKRSFYWEARSQEISAFVHSVVCERAKRDKQLIMSSQAALLLPSVAALLEGIDYEQEITQEIWDGAWGQIEKEMDEFADYARNFLIGLIRTSLPVLVSPGQGHTTPVLKSALTAPAIDAEIDGDPDMVALCSAYFQCNGCPGSPLLKYPALLNHHHPVTEMTFDPECAKYANLLLSSFSGQRREEVLWILGPQLQCLRCGETTRSMDWFQLIKHFKTEQEWYDEELLRQSIDSSMANVTLHNDHDLGDPSPVFLVLDGHTARTMADRWLRSFEYANWTCALCKWSQRESRTSREVQSHIRRNHLKHPEPGDMSFRHIPNF